MSVRKKKIENGENMFFKALANRFRLISKIMDDLLLNGRHEKIMSRLDAQFIRLFGVRDAIL